MNIIVLGTRGFPNIQGGIEKHCEELYPRLVALGCKVTIIGRAPYIGKTPYIYKGVTIHPISCPKHKYFESFVHTFLGIIKAKQLKCDILHIHAIGPALFVPVARMMGMKVVMTHHGPDYDRQKWNIISKMILKLGEGLGVLFAHRVIVISRVISTMVYKKFARETVLIPNGVVVCEKTDNDEILKRYQLEKGKYILAVGRFVPEKGFLELIESFNNFSEAGHIQWRNRYKLVIVGDTDHEDEYSRILKKKSCSVSNVILTGFQTGESLKELYSHAGLFVLPSYHEGLPIVLLEALSYGSSCLVSDIPANREVYLEKDRYFTPGDIQRMSQKFKEFFSRPVCTDQDRKGRIQEVINKYNWENISKNTFRFYEGIL